MMRSSGIATGLVLAGALATPMAEAGVELIEELPAPRPVIESSGLARMWVKPDRVEIAISIEASSRKSPLEAYDELVSRVQGVHAALGESGVDLKHEVTTDALDLYVHEEYPTGKETYIAEVEMTIERTIDPQDNESTTRFLRQVLEAGTTGFQRLKFVVNPDKLSRAQDALIELAIVDARRRARIVAAADAMQVGEVLSISLTSPPQNYPQVSIPEMAAFADQRSRAAIPIHAGRGNLLTATVRATFALEPAQTR